MAMQNDNVEIRIRQKIEQDFPGYEIMSLAIPLAKRIYINKTAIADKHYKPNIIFGEVTDGSDIKLKSLMVVKDTIPSHSARKSDDILVALVELATYISSKIKKSATIQQYTCITREIMSARFIHNSVVYYQLLHPVSERPCISISHFSAWDLPDFLSVIAFMSKLIFDFKTGVFTKLTSNQTLLELPRHLNYRIIWKIEKHDKLLGLNAVDTLVFKKKNHTKINWRYVASN